ncbi:MAG: ATP-dependent 6-phosphofructokinase [Elusimicrobia bacterium]|nr:ATP-dependent 6-phosphofructokinase [Elusimicrobiota bacterium]
MPKRVGLLTGGGDCPGLNPAIRAAVMRALGLGWECVAIPEGWKGLLEAQSWPLRLEAVEDIVGRGGTILGTSRTNPYKKEGDPQKAMAAFKTLGLDALIAMGGEDTLGVAAKLHRDFKAPVVGVPKTMDNDLSATDYTFGFDTSVTVAMDAAQRLLDTGRSHRRIMVLEVMGRHAGWVALYTGIASGADAVCLPERPVDAKALCEALRVAHRRKGAALVVTSEAVEFAGEDKKDEALDEFGHMILKERGVGEKLAGLIQTQTGIETRAAVIGHIQRGGPPTLFDRMLATRAGLKAMDLVHAGRFGLMAALKGGDMTSVPLAEATAKLKTVTPEWLSLLDQLCPPRATETAGSPS